ncbi:hypothetical protein TWF694_011279 [Orbilia ellipsospora]|uniref:Uncharacterized protein n=1 Tax=Orbilia ellipsospora TaxID=2528407 RepID=A0AAV9XBN3_9PEZI
MPYRSNTTASCPPIQGNSDFYGEGIRIGVYLQWLSAWTSILADPLSTQSILEANSVFVFAIVIATICANRSANIKSVETYIMLQIALGFFLTTMSTFGVRLQLLHSQTASQLLQNLKEAPHRVKMSLAAREDHDANANETVVDDSENANPSMITNRIHGTLSLLYNLPRVVATIFSETGHELPNLHGNTAQIDLDRMAFLKHQNLAWSGVLWRANIASVLAGFNIVFWFYSLPSAAATECVPTIFVFSKQLLDGRLLGFFKACGIIIAIGVFPQAVVLAILFVRLVLFLATCIYRDFFFNVILRGDPKAREQFQANFLRISRIMERLGRSDLRLSILMPGNPSTSVLRLISPFRSFADTLRFLSSTDVDNIRFSDILKLCAGLASQHVSVQTNGAVEMNNLQNAEANDPRDPRSPPTPSNNSGSAGKWISICWNILMFLTIVWFILSIELTIAWNDIQGVNTIQSTGQLIPFIIGVTSAAQAIQNVFVSTVKKASNKTQTY